ncbi:hypothetical protein COS21_02365 [bacterium (Candidatus Gribaldobacteria) CG02_land_8_20_14_3_00_41_15]|uniref:Metallo-beta-lactamase domain-containing protein n=1 Tax=bacterium (Candidatus Gribaldobacteria) CG02_land_8_20_14_3_00_41_15 TaxID=2014270 RepID=A0A2M7DDP7_9BACT|nr:MAG: hypothetical protein COS21_02365 [bacterium (Candidatus Gribaldobacteria) CG02_land_8_20_14_3_00_41_15]
MKIPLTPFIKGGKKLYKIFLIFGIAVLLAGIVWFWLFYSAAKNLEVDFLDVGQGDAILIKAPGGQNILIDGGPDKVILKRLAENLAWWDKTIDLMILTHPHDDHVAGLIEVLKRYQVEKILYTGVTHNAPNYLAWLKLVREKKVQMLIIDKPQIIKLGAESQLEILYPDQSLLAKAVSDLNQSSIVMMLAYGKNKFLLTGDAGEEVERKLIDSGTNLSAEVLKVGHHGSQSSTSEEFLNQVKPNLAVISVGKDNDFGHPSLRTVKRLERAGAEIYRTDEKGTVRIESDGEKIRVK